MASHHVTRTVALVLFVIATISARPSLAKSPHVVTIGRQNKRWTAKAGQTLQDGSVLALRGGFNILGLTVPASGFAKFYVGFNALNGAAMAVIPTIAASSYGSAFDDSKESLLATLLLERQGDAVLGTSIFLHLSTFTEMPIAHSVAWSAVPYVVSLLKYLVTGQFASLGFYNPAVVAILCSILLPILDILKGGWNPKIAANILASLLLLIGGAGSLIPVQCARLEGLDMADAGEFLVSSIAVSPLFYHHIR